MRIEERRDKEVIGGGFGQWEKDCPAIVHSLPISAVAAQKITQTITFYFKHVFLVLRQQQNEGKRGHVTFPTNFSLKVTFNFKVKACAGLISGISWRIQCLYVASKLWNKLDLVMIFIRTTEQI